MLAVDPTSPYTGGALLGDRVRMQEHATDPGVFIRSMATRGHLGGMALAAPEAVRILDAAGYERVVVETVGVGQAEVDVAAATDTAVVVLAPGLGDAVQMAKAGILEVADVFVVNKADRDGAPEVVRELRQMLHLGAARDWDPPVLTTSASRGRGHRGAVGGHRVASRAPGGDPGALAAKRRPGSSGGGEPGRRAVPAPRRERPARRPRTLADELAARRLDPYRAAAMLAERAAEYAAADRHDMQAMRARTDAAATHHVPPTPASASVDFETLSGEPLEPLYTPEDLAAGSTRRDARAARARSRSRAASTPSMYRGRLWTMRQFAGFGTPAETNARYRFLLEQGQGGLSVAFDMPTLMGLDSDDPRSEGEVGRCGVATDSLDDFETLFDGIPLGDISTSMTISGPAVVAFAFFLATAERQGVPWDALDGTLQTDILKEYIAQKEWIFPPRPHLRLIGDLMAFCAERVPQVPPDQRLRVPHPRGRRDRGAGARVHARRRVRATSSSASSAGSTSIASRAGLSFFFNSHIDFFEEIAKFRAARRIWARWLRDRYGATDPAAMRLRFHTQTAGVSQHRAAADEQRRADGHRGARRGARGHAVAAHERARRGAGAADRGGRQARAAHAAGHRVRDRRRPT